VAPASEVRLDPCRLFDASEVRSWFPPPTMIFSGLKLPDDILKSHVAWTVSHCEGYAQSPLPKPSILAAAPPELQPHLGNYMLNIFPPLYPLTLTPRKIPAPVLSTSPPLLYCHSFELCKLQNPPYLHPSRRNGSNGLWPKRGGSFPQRRHKRPNSHSD
jgi:hypothetical protein